MIILQKLKGKQKQLTLILFVIYLLMLTWIILFKFSFSIQDISSLRSVNLIPLKGTAVRNNQLDYVELLSNVLIFVPFGIYVSMLKPHWRFLKQLLPFIGVSLLFEIFQYVFAIGATDITDLLGNTVGGIIGIILCVIFKRVFKDKALKTLNIIAMIGTVGAIILSAAFIV